MEFVLLTLLTFFAIIGISHLILSIAYYFTKIKDDNSTFLVIPRIDKNFDVEFTLRSICAKVRWLGKSAPQHIVCLSDNMDEKSKLECELLTRDFEYIEIMTKEEFLKKAGL